MAGDPLDPELYQSFNMALRLIGRGTPINQVFNRLRAANRSLSFAETWSIIRGAQSGRLAGEEINRTFRGGGSYTGPVPVSPIIPAGRCQIEIVPTGVDFGGKRRSYPSITAPVTLPLDAAMIQRLVEEAVLGLTDSPWDNLDRATIGFYVSAILCGPGS